MRTERLSIAAGAIVGLLVGLAAARGAEVPLPVECGALGGLQAFRIRVPVSALEGADPLAIIARPAAGGSAKVSLVHLNRSSAIPERLQGIPPRWEGEEELQRAVEESVRYRPEKFKLAEAISTLEEIKKDSKDPQIRAKIDGQIAKKKAESLKIEDEEKAAARKVEELQSKKSLWQSAARETRDAAIEIAGLYSVPGEVRIDLIGAPSPTADLSVLKTITGRLPASPGENPAPVKAWAGARALHLTGWEIIPEADADFHRYTIHRLRRRFALEGEGLPDLEGRNGNGRFRPSADLYSVTTGALAIEESLQLDVALRKATGEGEVPLAELSGPKVKSHPFRQMLEGRSPKLFPAAALVPEENWYAHFTTIGAEIRLSDLLDQWGTSFLQTLEVSSRDRRLKEKLLEQLAIDLSVLTRLFGDLVIGEMALTGSDLYLHDGSDVAILLQVKNRPIFEAQMARYREEAKKRRPDARESTGAHQGVKTSSLATDDRRISSHSADLGEYRVYANSLPALQRVIDAQAGRLPSLAAADDFKYMRSVFPGDPAAEDAFLYLSDRFIRNVVGPRQKIARLRQLICNSSLRILEYALLEWTLEKGAAGSAPTLEALFQGGLADPDEVHCPAGGRYRMATGPDGPEIVCSVHNRLRLGTPLVEIPVEKAGAGEAQGYRQFVESYERYWSQYFDPVGIRFRVPAEAAGRIEAETCILPLIENSIYDGLRQALGGQPVQLTAGDGPRAIGSLSLKFPRSAPEVERFFRGMSDERSPVRPQDAKQILGQVGDGITLTLHDGDLLFTFGGGPLEEMMGPGRGFSGEGLILGALLSAITLPVSLSIDVKDPAAARPLLDRVLGSLVMSSRASGIERNWRSEEFGFEVASLDDYRGVPVGLANLRFFFVNFQLHYAFLGRRLVVATQRWIITESIDRSSQAPAASPGDAAPPEPANLLLRVSPDRFQRAQVAIGIHWQSRMRETCFANFPVETVLLEGLGLDPARAEREGFRLFGYVPFCPAGGSYRFDGKSDELSCTVHRTPYEPRQPSASRGDEPFIRFLSSLKTIEASFRFTPEGIRTRVAIERKASNP